MTSLESNPFVETLQCDDTLVVQVQVYHDMAFLGNCRRGKALSAKPALEMQLISSMFRPYQCFTVSQQPSLQAS